MAKACGYEVILVFIRLDDVSPNQARIAQRVQEGGHAVPPEKVETRIPRRLVNIQTALPLCDRVYIIDNRSLENPFIQVTTLPKNPPNSLKK